MLLGRERRRLEMVASDAVDGFRHRHRDVRMFDAYTDALIEVFAAEKRKF